MARKTALSKMRYDEVSLVDAGAGDEKEGDELVSVVLIKRDSSVKKLLPSLGGNKSTYQKKKASDNRVKQRASETASVNRQTKGRRQRGRTERAQNWKDERHPRNPKGSGDPSGEFTETSSESKRKYGKGGTTGADLKRGKKKRDPLKMKVPESTRERIRENEREERREERKKERGDNNSSRSRSSSRDNGGGPPPVDRSTSYYKVKSGDTLWDIAERYLGDGSRWKELGFKGDPKKLPVGTKLTIRTTGKGGSKGSGSGKGKGVPRYSPGSASIVRRLKNGNVIYGDGMVYSKRTGEWYKRRQTSRGGLTIFSNYI